MIRVTVNKLRVNGLRIFLAVVMCLFVTVGCSQRNEVESPVVHKDSDHEVAGWVEDEVLTQLTELRLELRLIREEISSLKNPSAGLPKQQLKSVRIEESQSLGDQAKIAIVEFSDIQCPYCARHDQQVFPELKKKYIDSGKLRYVARDFPLSFHAQARPAALAAHCAGDQEKYWEMRHFLFASNGLNDARYQQGAEELGVDESDFSECMTTQKYADRVENDFIYGQKLGVSGTPRFFIGRVEGDVVVDVVPLSGAQPFSAFERVIESFLE